MTPENIPEYNKNKSPGFADGRSAPKLARQIDFIRPVYKDGKASLLKIIKPTILSSK